MEIDNRSDWDSKELKQLFTLVSEHEGFTPRHVVVEHSRTCWRGLGTVNGSWVKISIPNWLKTIEGNDLKTMAQVYTHEIGHNRGLKHRNMINAWSINVDYINGAIIHKSKTAIKKKESEKRVKLKNLHYKGYIAKIYRYPWRVTSISQNGDRGKGFWYTYIIHNKTTNIRLFRTPRNNFFENVGQVHKVVKERINDKINRTK